MTEPVHLSKEQIAQWRLLLGRAPVLSSEAPELFEVFYDQLVTCLRPRDVIEIILIWHYGVEAWRINRAIRHSTVAIERRYEDGVRERLRGARLQHAHKQNELRTQLRNQTPADIAALSEFEERVLSTSEDVDEILIRKATELDHNRAFERSMVFQEQLDKLIASASRRRDDALQQLELYRIGLGVQAHEAADRLLEAEAQTVLVATEAPPLAPASPDVGLDDGASEKSADGEEANGETPRRADENADRIEDD